ncbi:putative reverse transcriptase domain-containing protein [Tanacetum coccineum]
MILAAQGEAFNQENVLAERLHGLDQQMEIKRDKSLYFMDQIWVLLVESVMDEAHASRYLVHPGADKTYYNLGDMYWYPRVEKDIATYVSNYRICLRDNSKKWNSGDDQLILRWMIYLVVLADAAESVRDAIGFECCLASSSGWIKVFSGITYLHSALEEIKVDKTLCFVEKPVEIIDRKVESLKRSRILIVKSIGTRSDVMRIS